MAADPTPGATGSTASPGRPGGLCGELHDGLDRLDGELDALTRATGVTPSQMAAVMGELTRLVNRAQALRDKGAAIAARSEVPDRVGARSTGHWLARVTSTDQRAAQRQARRAEAAGLAAPRLSAVPEEGEAAGTASDARSAGPDTTRTPATGVSATGRAQLAGDLSPEQVDVITASLAGLPEGVPDDKRDACERELIALAANRSPADLRRLAARVLERTGTPEDEVDRHEDRQVADAEDTAWERAAFWMKDNEDGTMFGQFTVPTAAGLALKKILDAMSSPRRSRDGAPRGSRDGSRRGSRGGSPQRERLDASAGDAEDAMGPDARVDTPWFDRGTTWKERQLARQQRQGQDLAILLRHLPTDHLHEKAAATIIVTTRLSDLRSETARVGRSDTGHLLSTGEVRRLACESGIVPALLGSESQLLDLGRQVRCFTSTQRAALAMTYTTCAADGCDTPFAWTEIHHLKPWQDGGATDLANAVPLCGHHHRLLDRGYEHTLRREGRQVVLQLSRSRT